MHIALIGMSNIGKSHWARRFAAEAGYERVDCDHLIERKLESALAKQGLKGIHDVARWMGQPYDPQYAETSRAYLDCEKEVMLETIEKLRAQRKWPSVVDTSGSVVATGDTITSALRQETRVIYLEASKDHIAHLFERFIASPKPVIWGDVYAPRQGETPQDTLKRCYPELLAARAQRYSALAHVTIPYAVHAQRDAPASVLLKATA